MTVEIEWPKSLRGVKNVGVAIIMNTGEFVFGTNIFATDVDIRNGMITYDVKLNIGPGKYHLMAKCLGIQSKTQLIS